jgi:pyruvate dehydrogenase E2 component (dihydrolipoamide acetyltransferase)
MYEIVMPQLSDSMDEGKLISWKVNVGDTVHAGDTIAEVESDKAVMEVQSFKDGVVKELKVKAGDEAKIGSVIAVIDTGLKADENIPSQPKAEPKPAPKPQTKEEPQAHVDILDELFSTDEQASTEQQKRPLTKTQSNISPKAKAKAASYGLDIDAIAQKESKAIVHDKDVDAYMQEKYFTPKALRLLKEYQLSMKLFDLKHKIDEKEVQEYIQLHEIPLPLALTPMQKAIIANVNEAVKRPIYHLYESISDELLLKHHEHSITVWLIKIVSKVMMSHDAFRSTLSEGAVSVWPNASISVAVANDKDLYMPVVKDANKLKPDEIDAKLKSFKSKLQNSAFSAADMQGSTLGISNLGMLGVERFDAMLNKNDAAIIAVGTSIEGRISLTLTADHSLINGYEAALFMKDVKEEAKNPLNFKD